MYVSEILKVKGNEIATVRSDSTIATAVGLLKLKGIGALVVSDDGATVAGILSERDIVRALADHGGQALEMRVTDFMSWPVKTCQSSASVTDVMGEMTRSRIRHLPVVDDHRLTGIISIGDVVKNRLDELQTETQVLREYIVGRS